MKSIELTISQIKAKENGASMFLFTIDKDVLFNGVAKWCKKYNVSPFDSYWYSEAVKSFSSLQKGDKFFVQEKFCNYIDYGESKIGYYNGDIFEYSNNKDYTNITTWNSASQMTYEQSRFKDLECIDVRVVRANDLPSDDIFRITGWKKESYTCIPAPSWNAILFCDFEEPYNQQMKEQNVNRTYEDNDYVFLVEFRG